MKVLDKIALILFSNIILIISVLFCLVIFGWLSVDVMALYLKSFLNEPMTSNIILGVLIVFILLAIKAIFFTSDAKTENEKENGILIQNENGKLFITKQTISNLVSGVVKEVEGAKDISSKVVLSKDNTVNIDVVLFVEQDVVIKELSNNLQIKIKEVVKNSMDIDIKEVNINIKNIEPKQEKNNVEQ